MPYEIESVDVPDRVHVGESIRPRATVRCRGGCPEADAAIKIGGAILSAQPAAATAGARTTVTGGAPRLATGLVRATGEGVSITTPGVYRVVVIVGGERREEEVVVDPLVEVSGDTPIDGCESCGGLHG